MTLAINAPAIASSDEFAATPVASVSTAAHVKLGARRSWRTAYRTSCQTVSRDPNAVRAGVPTVSREWLLFVGDLLAHLNLPRCGDTRVDWAAAGEAGYNRRTCSSSGPPAHVARAEGSPSIAIFHVVSRRQLQ
jgi:hypothetical protein